MFPVLFRFRLPEFLHGILPDYFTVYSYGFMIALGVLLSYIYTSWQAKRQLNISNDSITNLTIILMVAAFVGGKLFFYLEDPAYYLEHPSAMFSAFNRGFVFYGSLIFAVPAMIWYLKKKAIRVLPFLDIMAVTACIVHAFGRTGCFLAGCCHGIPTDSFLGVVFTNPSCAAYPLNTPLHPTQLYDVILLVLIIVVLHIVRSRQQFHGQLFLIYLALYAFGRSIIEIYRGDEERGFIIGPWFSYAQLVSLLIIIGVVIVYFILKRRNRQRIAALPETHDNTNVLQENEEFKP